MKRLLILAMVFLLISCGKSPDQKSTPSTSKATDAEIAAALQKVIPNYSMEEKGQYGYERGLSDDDKKAGIKTKSLYMVRYLGESNGTHSIQVVEGNLRQITTCKEPCEFVKTRVFYSGTEVKSETIRAAEGSIIWAIMQDAQNGHLKAPGKKAKSKSPAV